VYNTTNVVSSNSAHGEVNSVTCGRSVVFSVFSTNKTDHHDKTEILLKVALNTITLTLIPATVRIHYNYVDMNPNIVDCI